MIKTRVGIREHHWQNMKMYFEIKLQDDVRRMFKIDLAIAFNQNVLLKWVSRTCLDSEKHKENKLSKSVANPQLTK